MNKNNSFSISSLLVLIFCITSAFFTTASASGQTPKPPNILWITLEDMSPTLGCWGDDYALTPNIDRLCEQSVRYTNAFATAPVCSPARSCLITGRYATSLGTQRLRSKFPIPSSMKGFPALLRNQGYYCSNNVKTDYNTANEPEIIKASWDESSAKAHWRNRNPDQPFFAVFNFMDSHQSRTMVWPYEEFEEKIQSQLAADEIHDPAKAPVPPYYPDTPIVRRTIARFYDCVTLVDKQVGELLDQLEQDGLAEDTIVFFFSDHGSGMPRHKRLLLDTGLHVPFLIRFPEKYHDLATGRPGESVDRLVSFVDFGPTVLSVCGIEPETDMQGIPFAGRFQGPPRSFVFGARDRVDEAYDVARSIRNNQYLYIRNFMPQLSYNQPTAFSDQGEIRHEIYPLAIQGPQAMTKAQWHYAGAPRAREELYDVRKDPLNLHNLADSETHQAVLKELRSELENWMKQSHDVGLLPESEAWKACAQKPLWFAGRDPAINPLEDLIEIASMTGSGEQSLPMQIQMLESDHASIRYWAAVGLSAFEGKLPLAAIKVLDQSLQDPSAAVRIEAARTLVDKIQQPNALDVLVHELKSSDLSSVLHAARAIELLGMKSAAAHDALRDAAAREDGDADMRMFIQFCASGLPPQ